jgi:putative ABC transport system substrate-binding protein
LHQFAPREPRDFEGVFAAMVKQRVGAVSVPDNPIYLANARVIAELAIKHRLPLIGSGEFAEAGGLIGFGANLLELYRRAGFFVDKILKGTSPGVIPVEQPSRFEFVINMKTAKALGIKLPELFMQRAERLIQ